MKRGKTSKLRLTAEKYSAWEGKARAAGMTSRSGLGEGARLRAVQNRQGRLLWSLLNRRVCTEVKAAALAFERDLLEQKRRREEALEASSKNLPVI